MEQTCQIQHQIEMIHTQIFNTISIRTLTAVQVIAVYERTVSIYQLVQDVKKYDDFNVNKILLKCKPMSKLKMTKTDTFDYNLLLYDLKSSINNFRIQYQKRCQRIIGNINCSSETNVSNAPCNIKQSNGGGDNTSNNPMEVVIL